MATSWRPSALGLAFTGSRPWALHLQADRFELRSGSTSLQGPLQHLQDLVVKPGFVWASLIFGSTSVHPLALDGLTNARAKDLKRSVDAAIAELERRARLDQLLRTFDATVEPLLRWHTKLVEAITRRLNQKGWLAQAWCQARIDSRPAGFEWLAEPEIRAHWQSGRPDVEQAYDLWTCDLTQHLAETNCRHEAHQLSASKEFFETVEKSPLTEEQARAVVWFDSRVLLVASAGSGKTSTMVAKAGYALHHGYCAAERMLLLAFNNDAAKELRQRLDQRLTPLGLPGQAVTAKTFHAFGLEVIGLATGQRPTVAPWIESGRDLEALLEMVDGLKDQDPVFRTRWDLFRIVLGQDLPQFGQERKDPDAWNAEKDEEGFWTLNGEVVKSRGEQIIANWLFYNGVAYEYEKAYEHPTADATHRQYHPDFYLPEVGAYLEHWALDENGNPPEEFVGYTEGMMWKRALHVQHGTRLLETTMADLWSGRAFGYLTEQLTELGVTLDPNPEREGRGRRPIENPRLASTFRSFLTHVKSNRLDMTTLRSRLDSGDIGRFRFRHRMFLDLFEAIQTAWNTRLRSEEVIDFDDMLNQAVDCIEQGRWSSPYELVMVDEFQDASQARARLIKALMAKPDTCLFAVGDDWQSINRFAGADLSVMTAFEQHFGVATTLKLETTFRCPPSLCDISSRFAQKNPAQLRKSVRSIRPDQKDPVRVVRVTSDRGLSAAVVGQLNQIGQEAQAAGIQQSVLVLGRYRHDRDLLPVNYHHPGLTVKFITAHASKGLEADHVILPKVTSDVLGFPSRVADDPVMQLAMPAVETYRYAEERRLFYVALTRAKQTVRLITLERKESAFVMELVKDHGLPVTDANGKAQDHATLCPSCGQGFLSAVNGKYGPFLGCSRYPRCRHTEKLASHPQPRRQVIHSTQQHT